MRTLQGPRDPGTHPGRLPVAPSLPTSAQRELSTVQRLNSRARGVFSPLRGGSAAKSAKWGGGGAGSSLSFPSASPVLKPPSSYPIYTREPTPVGARGVGSFPCLTPLARGPSAVPCLFSFLGSCRIREGARGTASLEGADARAGRPAGGQRERRPAAGRGRRRGAARGRAERARPRRARPAAIGAEGAGRGAVRPGGGGGRRAEPRSAPRARSRAGAVGQCVPGTQSRRRP